MKRNVQTSLGSHLRKLRSLTALILAALLLIGILPVSAGASDITEMVSISNAQIRSPQGDRFFMTGEEIPLQIYAGFIVVGAYNFIQTEITKDGKQVYFDSYNYTKTTTEYDVGTFTPTEPGTYTISAGTTNSVIDKNPDGGSIRKVSSTVTFTVISQASKVEEVKPKASVRWAGKGKAEITCPDAEGYSMKVYRASSKTGAYKLIKSTTASSYTDKKASSVKTWYYKVMLYAKDGAKTYKSKFSTPVKLSPYATAIKTVKPEITVVWSGKGKAKIKCANIGGYGMKIFRATAKAGKYKELKAVKKDTTLDKGLAVNKVYYYKVRLFYQSGKKTYQSKYSAVVKLDTYKKYLEEKKSPPPAIESITYSKAKGVKITWKKHSDAGYYLLYRGQQKEGVYDCIDCLGSEDNVAYDTDVVSGKTYYYQVMAMKGDEDFVAKSAIVSFKVP